MRIAVWMLVAVAVIAVIAVIAIAAAASAKKQPQQDTGDGSYFDGSTWQLVGYNLLTALVCAITLGIAYPWMLCTVQRWQVKHTVIHGRRLKFTGHGHQLIGKYLLWLLLTVITFGIYGIWLGLGMKKWVVKHTVYADDDKPVDSYFSGGAGGYFGIHFLAVLLTAITCGIGKPWADRMVIRWETEHTHIGGSPLVFYGTGGQLFVKYLLLVLLTPLTLGIYALCFPVILLKWQMKNTEAVYQTPEIQARARSHELSAVQDFAKYRIAANDQEIAAMKSGYTGKEDRETLERLAEENNPFAAYHLAKLEKGDAVCYEGRALELLEIAARGKVHSALLDMAKQTADGDGRALLTEAAQCGSAEASWLLAGEYENANELPQAAYWFKIAREWGVAEAKDQAARYEDIVKNIALALAEDRPAPKQSKAAVAVIVAVAILALLIMVMVTGLFIPVKMFRSQADQKSPAVRQEQVTVSHGYELDASSTISWQLEDSRGNGVVFSAGPEVFLDYEDECLYLEFAVLECQDELILHDPGTGWKTQAITGSGIMKVAYPYPSLGEVQVAVAYEDGTTLGLTSMCFEITEGNSQEAETWIRAHIRSDVSTGSETEITDNEADNTASSGFDTSLLGGDWIGWNGTFETAGGQEFFRCVHISFSADGTFSAYEMSHVIMDDGSCMEATSRHRYSGDYRVDGDILSLHYTFFNNGMPEDNNGREATTTHHISLSGEELQIDNLGYYQVQYDRLYRDLTVEDIAKQSSTYQTDSGTQLQNTILGNWEALDMVTDIYTGDDILYIYRWTFQADGTIKKVMYRCTLSDTGDEYYYGQSWARMDGEAGQGVFSISENTLTVTSHEVNSGIDHTSIYTVSYENGILTVSGDYYPTKYFEKVN